MQYDYIVTEQDYINFNRYHQRRSRAARILRIVLFALLAVMVLPVLFGAAMDLPGRSLGTRWIVFLIMAAIVAGVIALAYLFVHRVLYGALIRLQLRDGRHNDFLGPQTLIIYEDYMEARNATTDSRLRYDAVERIGYRDGCFFVYVGALKAILVPQRAFSGPEDQQAFLDFFHRKTGRQVEAR